MASRRLRSSAIPGNQCLASQLTSKLVSIPAPGTENDDQNPPRIAERSLFDASIGEDNLFNGDKYKWSLRLTAVNITNKYALYNFLSTFSGTHYVTPRAMTAEMVSTSKRSYQLEQTTGSGSILLPVVFQVPAKEHSTAVRGDKRVELPPYLRIDRHAKAQVLFAKL